MIKIELKKIAQQYDLIKEISLSGRYITLTQIEPLLIRLKAKKIGISVNKKAIYSYKFGEGDTHVLVWSQMHGNESTGTKSLFDLINFIESPGIFKDLINQICEKCTITFIPILNPDGAEAYTRLNANQIDLNRDAVDLSQPESKLLRSVLKSFNPTYCFNLHDQRTIFSVGDSKETATLSFLAPSINKERTLTDSRKETMRVIATINELMQCVILNRIGRYSDEFYPNATGDNFEKLGHHTILIESGHEKSDYSRENVRYYTFLSLLQGLNYISTSQSDIDYNSYFNIPNNTEYYLDKIYKNVWIESKNKRVDVGFVYKEILENGAIHFRPEIKYIQDLSDFNADIIEDKSELSFTDYSQLKRFLRKMS